MIARGSSGERRSTDRRSDGPIVDGHAHVWALEAAEYPWQPTFGYVPTVAAMPDSLLAAMDRFDVHHAVLVQPSVYGPDHRFLLKTVEDHRDRFLPIGLVDPSDSTATAAAARLVNDEGCVGLRVNLSLDPQRAALQANKSGWSELEAIGVPICIRATPAHHEIVKKILTRHQRLRIVVDHLGLPERGRMTEAITRLTELARFEHCWLKVAGLARLSASEHLYRDAWPLVGTALKLFGSSRMLWGSDFPTVHSDADYLATIRATEHMPFVSARDLERLMAGTSCELWGVPPRSSSSVK